jgi:hypothetical protein
MTTEAGVLPEFEEIRIEIPGFKRGQSNASYLGTFKDSSD